MGWVEGCSASWEVEQGRRAGVGGAAHAGDGVEAGGVDVEAIVDQALVGEGVDDAAHDEVGAARGAIGEAEDMLGAALEAERGLGDAGGGDGVAGGGGEAGEFELGLALREVFARGGDLAGEGVAGDIDDEAAGASLTFR